MRIKVTHDIGDLSDDCASVANKAPRRLSSIVRKDAREGNMLARKFARAKAGPHGKNYFKRISMEMTGPLSAEYGPTGEPKTDFIGVGFRHGENHDLPNSADIIAPKFAKDVADEAGSWFW